MFKWKYVFISYYYVDDEYVMKLINMFSWNGYVFWNSLI